MVGMKGKGGSCKKNGTKVCANLNLVYVLNKQGGECSS